MYKLEKIKKADVSKSGKIFFVLKEDKTEVYLSLGIMKNKQYLGKLKRVVCDI